MSSDYVSIDIKTTSKRVWSPDEVIEHMTEAAKKVVSVDEFAVAVGTGPARVRAYVRDGLVRAVRHGRRIVIPSTEVDRFLEAAMTAAGTN